MRINTHNINIRKASSADIAFMYEMVKELAKYEKEPDAVIAQEEEYAHAFKTGLIEGHIAEVNSLRVGMTIYYKTFSTWKGITLYLEDFYVMPQFRQYGIGQMLFDAFLDTAKSLGCRQTKWQVLDWNEPALKFYEKNGAIIERGWWNGKIYL